MHKNPKIFRCALIGNIQGIVDIMIRGDEKDAQSLRAVVILSFHFPLEGNISTNGSINVKGFYFSASTLLKSF